MARKSYFSMKWRYWGPLCTRATRLVLIFIVLAHLNKSPRIDMSAHPDTFSRFPANQSFSFSLMQPACLAEKQHIPIS